MFPSAVVIPRIVRGWTVVKPPVFRLDPLASHPDESTSTPNNPRQSRAGDDYGLLSKKTKTAGQQRFVTSVDKAGFLQVFGNDHRRGLVQAEWRFSHQCSSRGISTVQSGLDIICERREYPGQQIQILELKLF
jgi:hypothetical protein